MGRQSPALVRGARFDTTAWLREHAPAQVEPEHFRLTPDDVIRSPVDHRLLVVWGDPRRAGELRRSAGPPLTVLHPPTGVFSSGLLRIWADAQWVTHMGPAVMAASDVFLRALRRLGDRILEATVPPGDVIVEVVAPTALARAMVASLYPDAAQIDLGQWPAAVHDAVAVLRRGRLSGGLLAKPPGRHAPGAPPAVLFVLASARSGTTWLSRLLQTHPEVAGIGEAETWLFEMLAPLWRDAHDPAGLGASVSPARCAPWLREFCDALFSAVVVRDKPRARLFVEKTPGHARHVPMLAAVYPDATFVHLVRDGRDVARSLSGMAMADHPGPGRAAAAWRDAVRAVRVDGRLLPRLLDVRYEALVADPVKGVGGVLEWAGCPVGDAERAGLAAAAGERVSGWSAPASGPGGQSWQSLTPWALARVYASAGPELVAEGYLSPGEWRTVRRQPRCLAARMLRSRHRPAARPHAAGGR